jgi:hypothetical protein
MGHSVSSKTARGSGNCVMLLSRSRVSICGLSACISSYADSRDPRFHVGADGVTRFRFASNCTDSDVIGTRRAVFGASVAHRRFAIRECYRGLHRRSSRRGRDSFGMGRRAGGRESWQVFVHAVLKSRYRQRACGKGRVLCPGGRGCCMVMRATLYQAVQRADIPDG